MKRITQKHKMRWVARKNVPLGYVLQENVAYNTTYCVWVDVPIIEEEENEDE